MCSVRLGVLGGTFDPVHFGHLRLAAEAASQFGLQEVLFIPAGAPPHKLNEPVTGSMDRWAMTVLATVSHPQFRVSRLELDRVGPSYSVDTLGQIHALYGPGTEIYFILGADSVLEMASWRDPAKIIRLCFPVIARRPGFDLDSLDEETLPGIRERARMLSGPVNDISSTEIRDRVRSGKSIRYLTPEPVADYIHRYHIYTESSLINRGGAQTHRGESQINSRCSSENA